MPEYPAEISELNKEDVTRLYAAAEREDKPEVKVEARLTELARLRLLEAGEWRKLYPQPEGSQSDADLEYCIFLAREHRGQRDAIDEAFRQSKLMRDKWNHQRGDRTYGERTLDAALARYKSQPEDVDPESWPTLFPNYEDWTQVEEPKWVIEGLMHEGEITMDGALPKHGKTWWELAKAKALLSGEPFLGHFNVVEKAKRVVYLVPEAGLAQMKRRLVLMRMMEFVREGRLFVMPRRLPLVTNLDDPRIMKAAEGADVFLDTVVRFVKGDENKAVEVKQFSELCLNLATIARTVHAAHHAPKAFEEARRMTSENMLRGSGDLGAMISNAFGLRQIDKETNRIHVSCLVARDDDEYLADFQIEGRPHINQTGGIS